MALFIRVKKGAFVRNPIDFRRLPEDKTIAVENNSYWRRRIKCGECIEVPQDPAPVEVDAGEQSELTQEIVNDSNSNPLTEEERDVDSN